MYLGKTEKCLDVMTGSELHVFIFGRSNSGQTEFCEEVHIMQVGGDWYVVAKTYRTIY